MLRTLLVTVLLAPAAGAQVAPQNPVNLFVADVRVENGAVRVGTPRKLTGDRGRNSQPSFTPDGRAIVFNAVRDSTGQGDVYRMDLATGVETRVTNTPENENSPTLVNGGELAVIRWVPSTLFREWGLWLYGVDGTPRRGVLPGPDTVGYYVQVDDKTWALMRPAARPAVAIFDAATGTTTDVAWPSANLPPQRIPGSRAVSFTRIDSTGHNLIVRIDVESRRVTPLGPTVLGRRIHAWLPGGTVLMAKGNSVYARHIPGDTTWTTVTTFIAPELQDVATYVVSPDGGQVILTSPLRPPLVTMLRDYTEAGGSMAEAVARARALKADGRLKEWWVSESDLVTLATARRQSGHPEESIMLLDLAADLIPRH